MNSLEQYTNHFNSDDTASYSSVESSRNLILPHPAVPTGTATATAPSTSALSVTSTKSSMTSSTHSNSYNGDDNSINMNANLIASSRSKSIEDASQGLLSIRKRKAERRPTTIALPNNAVINYSDVPPRGKRLRRQSSSLALVPAAAAAAASVQAATTKPSKKVKKNEIISIAQKSLEEAMGILTAFQESSPSSSAVASTSPQTAVPASNKNDQHLSAPTSNPVPQDSSSRDDSNAKSSSSSSSPVTATSVNLRIKQLEDGIMQVQTNFNKEMKRLEKELKELKQQCQPSSTPTAKSTSVPDTNTNEAFALENYSKHVQDSFKASKLLDNNNNDSNTTASSSSPSFYLAPRSAVSFASFQPSTPAVSAFVPTPETANTTTTTPSASTANTNATNNSTITQPTDKDVISGRGHGANRHGGNQIYRHLVKKYKFPYVKAISDLDKHNISMQVVNEIHEGGGRFLKRVYGNGSNGNNGDIQWAVMDMMEVKKKVGQALRENASEVRDILLKQSAAAKSASASSMTTTTTSSPTLSSSPSPALVSNAVPIIAKSPSPIHMTGGDVSAAAIKMSPTHTASTSPVSSPVLSQGFSNPRIAPSA